MDAKRMVKWVVKWVAFFPVKLWVVWGLYWRDTRDK